MVTISEDNRVARVDLCGNLDRHNIVLIKQAILECIHRRIRTVEFHFNNVEEIDAPAMAVIGIMIKSLRTRRIRSKIKGLTEEYRYLAAIFGLPLMAEIETEVQKSWVSGKTANMQRKAIFSDTTSAETLAVKVIKNYCPSHRNRP